MIYKLFIAIVKKGTAKKAVRLARGSGLAAAATVYARGIGKNEKTSFLGMEINHEKEVILMLIKEESAEDVIAEVSSHLHFERPGTGLGLHINISGFIGVQSPEGPADAEAEEGAANMKTADKEYDLIVTIVKSSEAEKIVKASKDAGADGATIISGRGIGINEKATLFNMLIEPEKEIVLTIIHSSRTQEVFQAICDAVELNVPGNGISFILDVDKVAGINH
ncbi:P-II family nitrogen regulator [Bacillus infantis]|uniref:P-II family nitrogen regulator n=1 Tax=Bacillus infantis TaxID=324767 RepID=UPI0021552151|nr:P-II family nitrogen regulator [Bacillus infantis]MCR6609772.1 P-II family nitrogen regulator [Bacillus infantis]